MKQKMLLLGALFFGFLAFILAYQQIQSERNKALGEFETVYLIRLTRNVAAGEELKRDDLARDAVQRSRQHAGVAREIPWEQHQMCIGRKLETSLGAGHNLQYSDLQPLSQQQGFTRKIQRGMRAISIPVDLVSAVNNLIKPNDDVDIIGTFRFPDARGDSALDTVTMTMLQGVKVLAVGSRWDNYVSDTTGRGSYATVTLLVYPSEAEMLIFASQKGRLSLSLRNFDDKVVVDDQELRQVDFAKLNRMIPEYNTYRIRNRLQQ